MNLYLSSYRIGNNAKMLKEWNKNNKKILVIPNALDMSLDGERKTNGIINKCNDLIELGFEYEILDLRNYFGKEDELRTYLSNYNSFYVLGGNVFVLRQAMNLSGFDNYLRDISNNPNYLYAGFSAGICVLAQDLHGMHLVDNANENPYSTGKVIWEGVGLIDFMPVPHYDTPNHPESNLMYDVVKYLQENNLPYQTLKDGEAIEISSKVKAL